MLTSQVLQSLGFSPIAAKLYLAALSLGTVSIQTLASKADIKRPTAYNYIAELVQAGWVEQIPIGRKIYYRVADPTTLEQAAKKNLEALQEALPQLSALYDTSGKTPTVTVYTGARAVAQLHSNIAQANTIRFWSDLNSFERLFPEAATTLAEAIAHNQVRAREIIPNTLVAKRSAKRYAVTAGRTYACRVAAKGNIYNNSVVYDDTVLLFRLHGNNLSVVCITDGTIATTFCSLFDLAWEAAEPLSVVSPAGIEPAYLA